MPEQEILEEKTEEIKDESPTFDFGGEIRALASRYPEVLSDGALPDDAVLRFASGIPLGEAYLESRLASAQKELLALKEELSLSRRAPVRSASASAPTPGEGEDMFLLGFERG
ncbi:MAG: hypothetical protein MJ067_05390 [Oscillospiraceae bacterium]|nr:hypothetical protein [Oscillospiraceae bacterium]